MKVLLILPHGPIHRAKEGAYSRALRYAPLTLAHLAALVPGELKARTVIVDEGAATWSMRDHLDADIACISCMTGTAPRAYALADAFRSRGVTVMMGGVHPTLMPHEAARHADCVITGLAEESFPRALKDFAAGRLAPRYDLSPEFRYRDIPFARRDLLDKDKYITVNCVQATRGCPNRCSFCAIAAAWKHRYYLRPVEEVIGEIQTFASPEIAFLDPSPMENRDYALRLFRALTPLKRWWMGCSTIDLARDNQLLDVVAKSGCRGLLVGFESLDQATLAALNKPFNRAAAYREAVKRFHDRGIAIQACFVFGSDTDDADVFDRTIQFVYDADIDLPQFSILTPFPGTETFASLESQGRIIERDWALYDAEHVVFRPRNLTPDQLQAGLIRAWRESYSLGSMAKRLLFSRCKPSIAIPANLGYRLYASRLGSYDHDLMVSEGSPEALAGVMA